MVKYQVALLDRPKDWVPPSLDAVPPQPARPVGVAAESEELFAAVRQAIDYNEKSGAGGKWAVVVEPGSFGRTWAAARVCTPITYKVTAIWWPEGWEPASPLDVPNCVFRAQSAVADETLTYQEAVARMISLNRQSMDLAGTMWYVILAVENEPLSQTVSYDPAGTETTVVVRRTHVVTPENGGHGDCSHCPAHSFQCAEREWQGQHQDFVSVQSRSLETGTK